MRRLSKQIFGQLPITRRRLVPEVKEAVPAAVPATRAKNARPDKSSEAEHIRELAYRHAVVALSAKLAACDKPANDEERKALSLFGLRKSDALLQLFEDALEDKAPQSHYASRLKAFFHHDKERLEQVVDNLFAYALADGPAAPEEIAWLYDVGVDMGLNPRQMLPKMHIAVIGSGKGPHAVLGVKAKAKAEEIRLAYRRHMAYAHPDKIRVGNAFVRDLFMLRYNQIQEAYAALKPHGKK